MSSMKGRLFSSEETRAREKKYVEQTQLNLINVHALIKFFQQAWLSGLITQ